MRYRLRDHSYIVCGLGLTGQACVRFLISQGAKVKAFDTRDALTLSEPIGITPTLGIPSSSYFADADTLILSPGISVDAEVVQLAKQAGLEVIGDVELFARLSKTPCIGITGSNGKTTVTLLVTHILTQLGFKACAAGNVGTPVLQTLNEHWDVIVLELSSFQLETTSSLELQAATVLNVTEDHLDRHGTLAQYGAVKQRIFNNSKMAVVWRDHRLSAPTNKVETQLSYGLSESTEGFGLNQTSITYNGEILLPLSQVSLAGEHNILNVMAALGLCQSLKVDLALAAKAVSTFESAPHRCVELSTTDGVRWIDDSKATNVGATVAAITGLAPTIKGKLFVIAGGDAKGADLSPLSSVFNTHVEKVFALGKDGDKIKAAFANTELCKTLPQAVYAAAKAAVPNDVVLLSPACASIDMFANYIERANVFASSVNEVVSQ